jgi:hypothetical protein
LLAERLTLHRAPTPESRRAQALHAAELSVRDANAPAGADAREADGPSEDDVVRRLPRLVVAQTPSFGAQTPSLQMPQPAFERSSSGRAAIAERLSF